jgi:hypothetical protein
MMKWWDSHMIASTLSRGSLGGVGICSPHAVARTADGAHVSVVGKGQLCSHGSFRGRAWGCFALVGLQLAAKQPPALLGGGGEADGGQRYQSRWPGRVLVFRLETPRGP